MKPIFYLVFLLLILSGSMVSGEKKPEVKSDIGDHFSLINGYRVHNEYIELMKDSQFDCWFKKPASNYSIEKCRQCNHYYLSQQFRGADNNVYTVYIHANNCSKSSTGYCSNLPLTDICPCKTNVGLYQNFK